MSSDDRALDARRTPTKLTADGPNAQRRREMAREPGQAEILVDGKGNLGYARLDGPGYVRGVVDQPISLPSPSLFLPVSLSLCLFLSVKSASQSSDEEEEAAAATAKPFVSKQNRIKNLGCSSRERPASWIESQVPGRTQKRIQSIRHAICC